MNVNTDHIIPALQIAGLNAENICCVRTTVTAPFIIEAVNTGWCDMWDAQPDDVIGKTLSVIKGPGSGNQHVKSIIGDGSNIQSFVDCGVVFNYPITKGSLPRAHRLIIGPIWDEDHLHTVGLIGVSLVSDQVDVADELARAQAESDYKQTDQAIPDDSPTTQRAMKRGCHCA